MPQELLRTIQRATGATECTMGYCSTETIGGVTYAGLTDSGELLTTTIRLPDNRVPSRIWVEDVQREATENEAGEIQVFGDWTMDGYWNRSDAAAAAFTGGGWMHTGDLAVRRNDGYIQIVGRLSEMFKSGGYNVYPREVELCLETAPGVGMAPVVSIPDNTFRMVISHLPPLLRVE